MQNVAIIGTTGSIGKAFLEYYLSDDNTNKVISVKNIYLLKFFIEVQI